MITKVLEIAKKDKKFVFKNSENKWDFFLELFSSKDNLFSSKEIKIKNSKDYKNIVDENIKKLIDYCFNRLNHFYKLTLNDWIEEFKKNNYSIKFLENDELLRGLDKRNLDFIEEYASLIAKLQKIYKVKQTKDKRYKDSQEFNSAVKIISDLSLMFHSEFRMKHRLTTTMLENANNNWVIIHSNKNLNNVNVIDIQSNLIKRKIFFEQREFFIPLFFIEAISLGNDIYVTFINKKEYEIYYKSKQIIREYTSDEINKIWKNSNSVLNSNELNYFEI